MAVFNTQGRPELDNVFNGFGDITGSTLAPDVSTGYTDSQLVSSLKRIWRYESQIRTPIEGQWERSLNRFNNFWDFSRKREWQSKRVIPTYMRLCYTIAWELAKPVLLSTGPLFKATTDSSPWRDVFMVAERLVDRRLKSNGENPAGDFFKVWYQCMLSCVLTGNCYMLVLPENEGYVNFNAGATDEEVFGFDEGSENMSSEDDELAALDMELPDLSGDSLPDFEEEDDLPTVDEAFKEYRIRFEALNPRDVFVDTGSYPRPKYTMWRQRLTPWEFRNMARIHGWQNVEQVIADKSASTVDSHQAMANESREKGQSNNPENQQKFIELCHFIGTLLDVKGEAIFENQYCSWAGNNVVQPPVDLGLWHGKLPIVHSGMLQRSFGAYHHSLAMANLDTQEARVEMLNSLLDYLHRVVNPVTEIDHDLLHPSFGVQWKSGLVPGGLIHKAGRGSNAPVISLAQTPEMPNGLWQGLGTIKQELMETTGTSEIGSMPRTRNRISADEAAERQAMSGGIWQQTILNIESDMLNRALYLVYCTELQCCPDDQWKSLIQACIDELQLPPTPEAPGEAQAPVQSNEQTLKKLLKMKSWNAQTRWKKMAAAFRFESKVFSSIESRRRSLEKLTMLNDAAATNPVFMSRVRWHRYAEEFTAALEIEPEEMLWPDSGQTQEQPQQASAFQASPNGAPAPVNPVVPPVPGNAGLNR